MPRLVSREQFISFLKRLGFQESGEFENRGIFLKSFAPGVIIEIVLFKGDRRFIGTNYYMNAYFIMPTLFPQMKWGSKDIVYIGEQYSNETGISYRGADKVDLERFKRLYAKKRDDLYRALSVVRAISKKFK